MNLEALFQQAFTLAGTFNPTLVVFLFIICFIGEFGICIPYLLETIWLMSGYNFGTGVIPLVDLLLLWLVAQVGRQAGGNAVGCTKRSSGRRQLRAPSRPCYGGDREGVRLAK